jgi:uncharacterized protein (TIGR02270 family)
MLGAQPARQALPLSPPAGACMNSMRPALVRVVVEQHVEDATVLHATRTQMTSAPHVRLRHLRRFDDRLAGHLDGLSVAGEGGWAFVDAALERPTPGAAFVAAVTAIEQSAIARLHRLCSLAEAAPELQHGLASAFGWMQRDQLQGVVADLLVSPDPFRRLLGVTACALHRVDPGELLKRALQDATPALVRRALRFTGELGRTGALPACLAMLDAEDAATQFWAAWSATLLGNRGAALERLKAIATTPNDLRVRALHVALQAMQQPDARSWLSQLAQQSDDKRPLIQGSGIAGDAMYVPWLIKQMAEPKTARLAGESFSLITGLDLVHLDLDRKPPATSGAGPNDNPDDPEVEMDPDDGLPWPDPDRIEGWWQKNASRFTAGTRYFLGATPGREHCSLVLREGFQRQRALAANYLCLLEPGTVLFNTSAPAWRQQQLLAQLN